jgi:hypothetical protein
MGKLDDWMADRLEWWPELGAGLGVVLGVARGFLEEGGRTVTSASASALAAVFVVAASVHWLTKRAYFDRHPEHFLAAQYSAALVLLSIGMGTMKEAIGTGTVSLPFLHAGLTLGIGALLYVAIYFVARRMFAPWWREQQSDDDG